QHLEIFLLLLADVQTLDNLLRSHLVALLLTTGRQLGTAQNGPHPCLRLSRRPGAPCDPLSEPDDFLSGYLMVAQPAQANGGHKQPSVALPWRDGACSIAHLQQF